MDRSFDIVRALWKRVPQASWTAFFTGLVVGVITHLYVMTNKLPNWDELSIGFQGGGYYFGRFLSDEYHFIFSWFSSPGVNGFLTVFFLSLAAAFAVNILRIHSITGGALAAAMFVTFPSVCSSMTYMFVAPVYGAALFVITIAVWITRRYLWGVIPGIVLIVISMGGYQAFFPYATALFVLALIADILEGHEDKEIILQGCRDLVTLGIGIGSYLAALNILHVEVVDYRGMQDIGSNSVGQYLRAILRVYHRMLEYFVTNPPSYAQEGAHKWNLAAVAVLAVLILHMAFHKEVKGKALRLFMYAVFTAIMPLAIGLIYVMSVEVQNASPLMIYAYFMLYVWIIVLAEHIGDFGTLKWQQVLSVVCAITLFGVGYMNFRVTSDSYYRMYIANTRVYGLYNRIIMRLEEQEGFHYGDRIHLAGKYDKDEEFFLDTYDLYDYKYTDLDGVTMETHLFMEPTRQYYLRLFLGIENPYESVSEEEIDEIKASAAYQEMPSWPTEGCIAQMNGIWIVKMN